jgi:hypothetical protein
MSDLTRAESGRINGSKSHGPKTPEGHAISSMNAVRHGISAKTLVLQNEDSDQFNEILNAYCDYLPPANPIEIDPVSNIVAARWHLRRIWRYETAMIDIEMDSQTPDFEKRFEKYDEDMPGGAAFPALADKSKGLSTALRYDIHLCRTYRGSLEQLRRLRSTGRKPPPPKKAPIAKRTQLETSVQHQESHDPGATQQRARSVVAVYRSFGYSEGSLSR